ncbi:MAG: serine/threonine protein kinase, partial [Holophagales bacterium]|nr:serine/threonine protein kinase [Holophagales bacterium]
ARTLARLDHPNVVRVYDFGHRDGLTYLIMELVDGVNLRQALEAGSLGPKYALALVPRICEALQYAHDRGVVHRDIKPENILIDREGTIKIADFGLAKLVGGAEGERLTRSLQIMGTPSYMAPEQIEHPEEVDHRADIYSLGVVFYEMLTGELPVGRFPPPSKKVEIDVRLDEVVLHTLEKEPGLRYQQASELRTDVETLSSSPEPAARRARHGARRSGENQGYEYRSERTLFGLPWVHIAFSRDPEGMRMRLASGIIAIGDMAIGGVAIGGFAFGGIAFGGIGVGLISVAGLALGLLAALGGIGAGAFVAGGFGVGVVVRGAAEASLLQLEGAALTWATFAGWLVLTLGVVVGIWAAIHAWLQAAAAEGSSR